MIKTYADIIVDITSEKLDRSFQYLVPQHLEGRLQPGMQVQVPFGNGGRMIKGYVIRVTDQPSFDVSRLDEGAVWRHDDSGVKDGTSGKTEDETERKTLDPSVARKRRSRKSAGTVP